MKRRLATEKDRALLFTIRQQALESQGITLDADVEKEYFYAENIAGSMILLQDEPMGFYQLHGDGSCLRVERVYILPQFQGRGIGKQVFSEFENLGYERLWLKVKKENPAREWYLRLGFEQKKCEKGYIEMEKCLIGEERNKNT